MTDAADTDGDPRDAEAERQARLRRWQTIPDRDLSGEEAQVEAAPEAALEPPPARR